MPQQLIYTSAPRGIVAGRSGYCTVARSAAMREALMLQLERFCYYQHLSLSGGKDRPIFSCRIADIRGTRFHVLSRIQDAGLDFTGRTNFIAHHLVFTPEEVRQFPTPPVILRNWRGWANSWTREPELLESESWDELTALANQINVPTQTWQQITGDAVNGYGLLEARVGATFRMDDVSDETVLTLLSESLELLEIRDTRRDFRAVAWNYTFTTSMQEQDNPADFRWRCLHSDNPAAIRLATPDCRALSEVRATKLTAEETAFARTGRLAPRFSAEPKDVQVTEGELARFTAKAEGVPTPVYQWYKCNKDGKDTEPLKGETSSEVTLRDPPLGVSRYRVWASNSLGTAQSRLVILSVEKKVKLTPAAVAATSTPPAKPAAHGIKSGEEIDRQRQRLEAEEDQEIVQHGLQRNKIIGTCLLVLFIVGTAMFVCGKIFYAEKPPIFTQQPVIYTNNDSSVGVTATATGRPAAGYQWYVGNLMIPAATNSSLSLAGIFGAFHVVASNAAGAVTSPVVQWLGTPPVITQQPVFQTNKGIVTITVSAAGANPLVYQWYKDGQTNPCGTGSSLIPFYAGFFRAIITNPAGAATSGVVHWEPDSHLLGKSKPSNGETPFLDPGLPRKNKAVTDALKTNLPQGLAQ